MKILISAVLYVLIGLLFARVALVMAAAIDKPIWSDKAFKEEYNNSYGGKQFYWQVVSFWPLVAAIAVYQYLRRCLKGIK